MNFQILKNSFGQFLNGPILITPNIFGDSRGFFFESWNNSIWNDLLQNHGQNPQSFVQDNHSCSYQGVLRGLHYQIAPKAQGKLVRCILGEIYDVAVDLRKDSTTFGTWIGCNLSAENKNQFWIPVGFAHGFLTISSKAEVLYKTTDFWGKELERSLIWNDPSIGIEWPSMSMEPILSSKDELAPTLNKINKEDLF